MNGNGRKGRKEAIALYKHKVLRIWMYGWACMKCLFQFKNSNYIKIAITYLTPRF